MCNSRHGPEKALTGEFYVPILRRLCHFLRLHNEVAVPVSIIHEVGEFALTDLRAMPEFSRLVQVDAIGADGADIEMRADAAERAALAQRLGLQSIADLQLDVSFRRTAVGLVRLNVDFLADVVQSCVVTLEPVAARVRDRFSLLCEGEQKRGKKDDTEGEVFVDPFGEDPVEPLDEGRIDVGELVAQHLSLSLDPYPRARGIKVGVTMQDPEIIDAGAQAGPRREGVNPFAVLERWQSDGKSGGQGDGGSEGGAA